METKFFNRIGIFVALLLGVAILLIFYAAPLKNPNNTFFARGGDGLKDYFVTTYFIKYDSIYSHSSAMNYPYGEHVMFTGNQTSISFPAKLISNHIYDVSEYAVGIINMFMLLSLVLGVVFIYLLLTHFKLHFLYSALVAVGIAFLSPQIARMGGHFSLSYVFVIPLILYLVALHDRQASYVKSTLLGLVMLWCAGTHVYMLGFYAFIVLCYWGYVIIIQRNNYSVLNNVLHFSLQFLLPFLIFVLYASLSDPVTDRPAYPYGFLVYRAYPESVLLPIDMHYGSFLRNFSSFSYIDWEGRAYVGTTAALGFLVLTCVFVVKLIKRTITPISAINKDSKLLHVFFWISILALLYSFGVPFVFGLQQLVDYLGPIKQMRGIARFSWVFFYVLNVFVFYKIWHLKTHLNKYAWYGILIVALAILWYDAFTHSSAWSKIVNNQMPAIADRSNEHPDNEWLQYVDIESYQALLPIPYFHIGSENIWIEPKGQIDKYTAMVSWKTGLPSMGVYMSRTSISQTISLCKLSWEPYRKPDVLKHFIADKDLLVIALSNSDIPPSQKNILSVSELLYDGQKFNLYRISLDSLTSLFENLYEKTYENYTAADVHKHGNYVSTSQEKNFYVDTFSDTDSEYRCGDNHYMFGGSLSLPFRPLTPFIEQRLPGNADEQDYVISFWINKIHTDLLLRSALIIELQDANGKVYDYMSSQFFREVAVVDGDWALIEKTVRAKQAGDRIRCVIRNWLLRNDTYTLDQIMIRNADTDVYRVGDTWIMKNNRFYHVPN